MRARPGLGFDKLSQRRQAQQVVEFIETTVFGTPSTPHFGTTINRINLINRYKLHQLNGASELFIRLMKVDGVDTVDTGLMVVS